jgi:tetratricopeptide (TPR) repeat protein
VAQWVSRLDTEIENLRATLSYYLAHPQGAESALHVAGSLWRFWEMRGYILEGRTWLDRALQRRNEAPPASQWLPLHGAGNLAVVQDEYAIANAHYEESLRLLQALLPTLQDPDEIIRTRYAIGNTLTNLGNCAILQSDYEKALAYSEEALALHRELVDLPSRTPINRRAGLGITTTNIAMIKQMQADYAQAEAYSEQALAIYRQLGDERGIGWNLQRLGSIARERGDYDKATQYLHEAQRLYEKLSNHADMPYLAFELGELARVQEQIEAAEAAYRSGLALAQGLGNRRAIATLLNALGVMARQRRNYAEAITLCEEAIALQRTIGDLSGLSDSLLNRGEIALAQQNFAAAADDLMESLKLKLRIQERKGTIAVLKAFVSLTMAERRPAERAARLLGAAESWRQRLGLALCEYTIEKNRNNAIRAALGPELVAIFWTIGQTMSLEQAAEYAMSDYKGK